MSPYTFDTDTWRNNDQIVDVTDDVCDYVHNDVCDECGALITLDTVFITENYYCDGSSARLCSSCGADA